MVYFGLKVNVFQETQSTNKNGGKKKTNKH